MNCHELISTTKKNIKHQQMQTGSAARAVKYSVQAASPAVVPMLLFF